MPTRLELENIDALRRDAGILDLELQQAVRRLRAGDHVRLTLLRRRHGPALATLLVRLTGVRGAAFRGKLVEARPPAGLAPGTPVCFTSDHIHSLGPAARAAP